MEKKCIYCNDLLDIKLHGLTKYCSAKCRNKDYYLKKKDDESKNSIESQSGEELSEFNSLEPIEQNLISGDATNYTTGIPAFVQREIKKEDLYIPETYKAILDEKSKNFELMSRIHMLEFRNEELSKQVNALTSEVSVLENEMEEVDDKEDNAMIFGMPKPVFENLVVQLLTPHAEKIIGGLMKKESA
jgi:hypothetical protein